MVLRPLVGWFGFCTVNKQDITIQDVFTTIHQKTSAANCTILEEGDNEIIDWEESCRALYGNGSIKAWFHSHVNMLTSPSGQDVTQLNDLAKDQPYYLRLIMNKKGDVSITMKIMGYTMDIKEYSVIGEENPYTEWANGIAKQVQEKKLKEVATRTIYTKEGTNTYPYAYNYYDDDRYWEKNRQKNQQVDLEKVWQSTLTDYENGFGRS